MSKRLTWNEIYERAIDTACGDYRLVAKDNARQEVRELVLKIHKYDIETAEIPENEVDYYCGLHCIEFYDNGSISYYAI